VTRPRPPKAGDPGFPRRPPNRIRRDVLANALEIVVITDDVIEVPALPERDPSNATKTIDFTSTCRLEGADDLTQRSPVAAKPDDGMHMVRHDERRVHVGRPPRRDIGQSTRNHGTECVQQDATALDAAQDAFLSRHADRDEVRAGRVVVDRESRGAFRVGISVSVATQPSRRRAGFVPRHGKGRATPGRGDPRVAPTGR
jgi:hypothetical protein